MLETTSERLAVRPARAAEMADISRSVIYQEMAAGRLAYVIVGSSKRVLVDDLDAWLRARRVAALEPLP